MWGNGEEESLPAVKKACSRTLGKEGVKQLSAGGRSVWLGCNEDANVSAKHWLMEVVCLLPGTLTPLWIEAGEEVKK